MEKDLGLDIARKGKEVYNTGGSFMIEMNLHNAGRPLADLIDKVENTMFAVDTTNVKQDKSIRSTPLY